MGFRPQRKRYRMTFEDGHELHGLEVLARSPTLGEYMELTSLAGKMDTAEEAEKMFRFFAEFLVSWNLEEEDGPIAPSYEALVGQDADFTRLLIDSFMNQVSSVPPPLQQNSSDGRPSDLERRLDLASLSESLPS